MKPCCGRCSATSTLCEYVPPSSDRRRRKRGNISHRRFPDASCGSRGNGVGSSSGGPITECANSESLCLRGVQPSTGSDIAQVAAYKCWGTTVGLPSPIEQNRTTWSLPHYGDGSLFLSGHYASGPELTDPGSFPLSGYWTPGVNAVGFGEQPPFPLDINAASVLGSNASPTSDDVGGSVIAGCVLRSPPIAQGSSASASALPTPPTLETHITPHPVIGAYISCSCEQNLLALEREFSVHAACDDTQYDDAVMVYFRAAVCQCLEALSCPNHPDHAQLLLQSLFLLLERSEDATRYEFLVFFPQCRPYHNVTVREEPFADTKPARIGGKQ